MPNLFWYGLLTVLSIFLLLFTLIKVRDRKVIVLYAFISGLTYLFEFVILVLFNSYLYHPEVLNNEYFDNILGAIVSNAFSVPMAATLIGALKLKLVWVIFITVIFLIIEWWFVHLKIYTHVWWEIPYTAIGLFLCFNIAKQWYIHLQKNLTLFVHYFTLYFTGTLLQASTVFIFVAIFNYYHYQIGWYINETRDHVAFASVYIFFLSILLTSLVVFKTRWSIKIITISLTIAIDWLLLKINVLYLSDTWHLWYFLIFRLCCLFLLIIVNKFFLYSSHKQTQ